MALKWEKASRSEQQQARRLHTEALDAGVAVSATYCLGNPDDVRAQISAARREAREAAAKDAAEAAKATLTPAALAARIGCAYSTARRWLRGINRPSPRYASALALAGIAL